MGLPGQGERPPALRRGPRGLADSLGDTWFTLSLRARRVIAGAAALIIAAILGLLAFTGGPPSDDTEELVPSDALAYVHIDTDSGSSQFDAVENLAEKLPRLPTLLQAGADNIPRPSGRTVSLADDLRPWLGDEAALAVLPGGGGVTVLLLASDDDEAARKFATQIAPSGSPKEQTYKETALQVQSGFASGFVDGFLVVGPKEAVHSVIDTATGGPSLAGDEPAKAARGKLPDERIADAYLSELGARLLREASPGLAAQLDTFLNLGGTNGAAAALVAKGSGVEGQLVSDLDPGAQRNRPSFFRSFPVFNPSLANEAGPGALAFLGIGDPDASLRSLLVSARRSQPALARSFRDFSRTLQRRSRVKIVKDVLPLLRGEGAVFVDSGRAAPIVTLIAKDVDEKRARATLARLSGPLLGAARENRLGQGRAPRIEEKEIKGTKVQSIRLTETVNLTFAVFDGKLVVSTDPAGVQEVKGGDGNLTETAQWQKSTSPLPESLSAVLFLNLEQVFRLAEQAGLAEDPVYASFSEDIRKLRALALGVNSDEDELKTKIFLTVD